MVRFDAMTTLDQFREVERLEGEIWGPVDLVPVPILAVSIRRGAVLVGAFDGARLVGFVYSFPALRSSEAQGGNGAGAGGGGDRQAGDTHDTQRPRSAPCEASHWSHMLGVHPDYRGSGLGRDLKLAQRERVLALGLDLIEWTYDPLQSVNAHLNIVKLGAVVEEYEENVYGPSPSPLHGGLPTDRFICQWWIRRPHVARRIHPVGLPLVTREAAEAPVVNDARMDGEWLEPVGFDPSHRDPRIAVEIPLDYSLMIVKDPERATRWRFHARAVFRSYLEAGYRVVDFALDRVHQRGRYLLTNIPAD